MFWDKLEKRMTYKEMENYTWTTISGGGIETDEMKESTYFKCIKYISESVAKCPIVLKMDTNKGEIEAKEHKLYEKLRLRPNPYMSAIDCMKAFVALGEHYGVSGLYIDRKDNSLYPVKIDKITIDDVGLIKSKKQNKVLIDFSITNEKGSCLEKDIILYKAGVTFDGINTKANKDLLKDTIQTNKKAQNYLGQLFDNGLTNKILVQMVSDIKDEKELKKVQEKFDRLYSNNGRTFTVPAGFNVSALNLSLADAQFEQIRKLSRREIANGFGLSPSIIGDLEDSNNNNMEMQNLSFLVDTLLIKFEQIEQELDWKYIINTDRHKGYKCRFNQGVMLRTNAETQANILTKYTQSGIYTVNDCRRLLSLQTVEGGDDILVSSGTYKLKDLSAITLAKKGGGNSGQEGN